MKDVKSPAQKRPVKLPPQQSATDTSNWESRNVSAASIDKATRKRVVRNVEFIEPESELRALTLDQIQKLKEQNRAKRSSK